MTKYGNSDVTKKVEEINNSLKEAKQKQKKQNRNGNKDGSNANTDDNKKKSIINYLIQCRYNDNSNTHEQNQ